MLETHEFTLMQHTNGIVITFRGNYDSVTEVTNTFPYTFTARKTRLYPIDWVNTPALKWELFGCGGCFYRYYKTISNVAF